jgi:predicted ferric reductase
VRLVELKGDSSDLASGRSSSNHAMTPNRRSSLLHWSHAVLLLTSKRLAPVLLLLVGPTPPRRGFWIEFSVALGFSGLSMLGLLFAMTARFRHMAVPYGIDVVYHFHRHISVVALLLILAHLVILFVAEPETRRLLNPITAPWRAQAAGPRPWRSSSSPSRRSGGSPCASRTSPGASCTASSPPRA